MDGSLKIIFADLSLPKLAVTFFSITLNETFFIINELKLTEIEKKF